MYLIWEVEPEWPSGIQRHACCMQHGQSWVWAPNHQCLHGSKRLGCHADLYTVSRCHTRGESEDRTSKKACKRDPPWLCNPGQTSPEVQNRGISETQGRHHQKSKTGVSVAPWKRITPSKIVKKKKKRVFNLSNFQTSNNFNYNTLIGSMVRWLNNKTKSCHEHNNIFGNNVFFTMKQTHFKIERDKKPFTSRCYFGLNNCI